MKNVKGCMGGRRGDNNEGERARDDSIQISSIRIIHFFLLINYLIIFIYFWQNM